MSGQISAPEADLERFFVQWLARPGVPVLDVDWWSVRRGAGLKVIVVQRQEGAPYALNLEVDIELASGDIL